MSPTSLPAVGVVVPTHARPVLLQQALDGIAGQTYPGRVETVVVYDRSDPDENLARGGPHAVRVMRNARTPGLAGARNTGIAALGTDLVAFCDDDDVWLPRKLERQVAALQSRPGTGLCTCAIEVEYGDRRTVRLAGTTAVAHADLLRSRMSMLHSSTFVLRRRWLVETVGLLDEDAPGSQNEDWDLLLRASAHGSIAHVDQPLVRVLWGRSSYYSQQWQSKAESLEYMMSKHADLGDSAVGAARVTAQLAFAHAAMGHRHQAAKLAVHALRQHPLEWRAPAALLVAGRLVSVRRVLDILHRFGRGV